MANILSDGLKFGKQLPGCLHTINLKSNSLSMYNQTGYDSNISVTLYRAFRYYAMMKKNETKNVGLAYTRDKSKIAEIHHTDGTTDLCIVKPSGAIYGAHHDGMLLGRYTIGRNARGGSVLYLALMDVILDDSEAKALYDTIVDDLLLDPDTANMYDYNVNFGNELAKLCDNVYMRLIRKGTSADINIGSIPTSGNLRAITSMMLEAEPMIAKEIVGNFHIYKTLSNSKATKKTNYTPDNFSKAFQFNPNRVLTEQEESMVPVLDKNWVIPYEAERICNHVLKTTSFAEPSRTFLLEGLAGTGKTSIATIVASGLHLPKVVYTCHAGTEIFDFIGQVMPTESKEKDFYTLVKELNLPNIEDIQYDLAGSYERLEGKPLPVGVDEAECIGLLIQRIMKETKSQGFGYVESDFIKALKYGWVCEIQEPTSILQQGVLIGLNSLLEPNGIITLPTGERIKRHPDTVIIFTTNPSSYKGCDTINQSVLSRVDLKISVEANDKELMTKKAMAVTGFKNYAMAQEMVDIVDRISRYLVENEIDDGVCGQRELKGWMQAVMVEGEDNVFEMALDTIISKATEDENEKEAIVNGFLKTSSFA